MVVLSGVFQPAHSQLYYKAKTITTSNGLSDNRVTCFHKDKKGFMWIGTRNGLNRYDGHSFQVFRPTNGNSISNEVVNDIAEDSRGRIWVATMEGLNIYDPSDGQWELIVPDQLNREKSIPNFLVWDIEFDQQDNLWIVCDVFEFCRYDINTRRIEYFDWPAFHRQQPQLKSPGYKSLQRMVRKNDHAFWLATNRGLVSLDVQTKAFKLLGEDANSDVVDLKYDPQAGKVYVSKEKGRLFVYDEKTKHYAETGITEQMYPSQHFRLPGQKEIWLASEKGLIKVSDDRTEISLEVNIPQLSGSLLPGGTRSVYEDDNRIRWIGTANGISVYDRSTSTVFLPLIAASDKDGVNRMGGVYYDEISRSYFVCSYDPSFISIINTVTGEIRRIASDLQGRKFSFCMTVKPDRNNTPWLLTGNAVYYYDRSLQQFRYFPIPGDQDEIVFRDMVQDMNGDYWFSSFHKGLFYYRTTTKSFIAPVDSFFTGHGAITGLAIDSLHKKLVVGTFGEGVFIYDLLTGKVEVYAENAIVKDYAQLVLANDVVTDQKGGIWISTHTGGIFRYNSGATYEKSFTPFDMRSGLNNNNMLSAFPGNDSLLWILSGKGISAINLQGKLLYDLDAGQLFNFSTYGSDSRFPHDIFYAEHPQQLLIGVGGGLLIYSPAGKGGAFRFPMTITGVKIQGESLRQSSVGTKSSYHLPFRSNTISFEFAGLYYGSASDIIYEYKLEGFDKTWINANGVFTVTYQNLPSGNFQFRVRARSGDGTINSETTGFPFSIRPPFWRTTVFIILVVLLLLAIIGWVIYSLQRKLSTERMVNQFATSLYGQNTTEDIFWDIAKNCVEKLGFTDCVIYQRSDNGSLMIQKAAYGPKNPFRREIANLIEIQVGKGIVGTVAQTGKPVIIHDTSRDDRYIVDDEKRLSEITVPVMVDGKVFAVIDSEHAQKHFYKRSHLGILKKIAAICSERITKLLTEERLRAKIARDLHDEMGSTLTSINIISKVAMEETREQEKLYQSFQKIKDHSGRMMESMSDMVWVINPVNDSFDKIIIRMKEFAAETFEPVRINYSFIEEGPLDETRLNLEQRKDIFMIFKEAMNNCIKYSKATRVEVRLIKTENELEMTISDNGKGFDTEQASLGNGLRNMRGRAADMGALIFIDSHQPGGTSVKVVLPLT